MQRDHPKRREFFSLLGESTVRPKFWRVRHAV
jgi:hypothetical protein